MDALDLNQDKRSRYAAEYMQACKQQIIMSFEGCYFVTGEGVPENLMRRDQITYCTSAPHHLPAVFHVWITLLAKGTWARLTRYSARQNTEYCSPLDGNATRYRFVRLETHSILQSSSDRGNPCVHTLDLINMV